MVLEEEEDEEEAEGWAESLELAAFSVLLYKALCHIAQHEGPGQMLEPRSWSSHLQGCDLNKFLPFINYSVSVFY